MNEDRIAFLLKDRIEREISTRLLQRTNDDLPFVSADINPEEKKIEIFTDEALVDEVKELIFNPEADIIPSGFNVSVKDFSQFPIDEMKNPIKEWDW